jgi:ABC-type multidrug transport system fused ATPase/permease subunit
MWKYGAKYIFWFLVMIAIFTAVIMLLWNWLVPNLFGGKMINYWQAMGLLVLTRMLTGLGKTGSQHLRYKMGRGWYNMPEDEKERLREKFKDRWCRSDSDKSA